MLQGIQAVLRAMQCQAERRVDTTAAAASTAVELQSSVPTALISWPGYGIFFFWQLGVLQYLETAFDLTQCTMVGSSAGSMLSVFAACGVEAQAALDLAHQLCLQHRVFDRPLGLVGVWGGLVRQWLDALLPPDAADRCNGRVRIVITTLPFFQQQVIDCFQDRSDIINCCLASSHLPFVMDWRATAMCRGLACVDGSMGYMVTGRCRGLKPPHQLKSLLLMDPWSDAELRRNLHRCVTLCGKDGAQQLLDQGFAHAKTLDAAGGFKVLAQYRKADVAVVNRTAAGDAAGDAADGSSVGQQQLPNGAPREAVGGVGALAGRALHSVGSGSSSSSSSGLGSPGGSCAFEGDAVAIIAGIEEATK